MKVCVLQVFFLFSSTKIGHGRPSVKDRYAISDKNILRSCVVRYFYLKFLAYRSSMPWFKDGTHDRVFTAMLQHTLSLTDDSRYLRENFTDKKELVFYSLEKRDRKSVV